MEKKFYAVTVFTRSYTREDTSFVSEWKENSIQEETYPIQLSNISPTDDTQTIKSKIGKALIKKTKCVGYDIYNRIMLEYTFIFKEIPEREYRARVRNK